MTESLPNFPNILFWAAPFFALFVALEWWGVKIGRLEGDYEAKDAFASMAMGIGQLVSDLVVGFISLGILMWLWQFRLFDLGTGPAVMIAALFAQDFVYYWKHRAAHMIRWLWSAHVVHHSSEHYNLSTALRQAWNNHFTGYVLLSSPLIFLGFHPLLIGFIGAVNLVYQFWIHTQAIDKMPSWFEVILNTPSHHRVHHGTNPRYLDSNFGGIFIVWDKLFGTFVPEIKEEVISYGIVKPIETFNPVKIAFLELVSILKDAASPGLSLGERGKYIFAPPGYAHDGSRQTSAEIKAGFVARNPDQAGAPGLPETSEVKAQKR